MNKPIDKYVVGGLLILFGFGVTALAIEAVPHGHVIGGNVIWGTFFVCGPFIGLYGIYHILKKPLR